MLISPFTPLSFHVHKTDGIASEYIQTFATTDRILIEMLISPDVEEGDWQLFSEPEHKRVDFLEYQYWAITDELALKFIILSPSPGLYSVVIGGLKSNVFRVTDNPRVLANTTLIQYSNRTDRQRDDVVFFIDGMQHFFDFRVHGGFKDSGWSFGVDNEQFVTQHADISQLYGIESTQKRFTLGGSAGVPVWFGEMLNRILTCSHVYFDGVKYTRKDASVPEMSVQLDGVNSFVFTQALQQCTHLDPVLESQNQVLMRRLDSNQYRVINNMYNRLT